MNLRAPCHEVQIGAVRACIWEEAQGEQSKYRVSIDRIIRPGEPYARPDRFDAEDLAVISHVLDMAHLWICQQADLVAYRPSASATHAQLEPALA
jgi:hypothetical protein